MPSVLVSTTIPPGDLAKLERVTLALRHTPPELRRELRTGLQRAVRPMQRTFRAGALGYLPLRGGLAEWVAAGMRFRTSVSVGESPRLRISASLPGHDLPALNRGRDRHPVFGHRDRWVTQQVRPRFWDDAGEVGASNAYDEIVKAVDTVAAKLEVEL
jgi:hypothetical protein